MKLSALVYVFALSTFKYASGFLDKDFDVISKDMRPGDGITMARGWFLGNLKQEHQVLGREFFKEALAKFQATKEDVKGSDWNAWLSEKLGSAGASGPSEGISGAVEEVGSLISKIKP
ncbi:uncharacterized protein UTRI_03629_B [Ustilago trichophora]|uniref:Uncharacterized protein n=1 Tax=Ustilago trichophora TaxID=86804 RepID=A0A5C3E355_9BASI|nr:uncharacterized protein UTRI_03629_B [Ustilago trichophora]